MTFGEQVIEYFFLFLWSRDQHLRPQSPVPTLAAQLVLQMSIHNWTFQNKPFFPLVNQDNTLTAVMVKFHFFRCVQSLFVWGWFNGPRVDRGSHIEEEHPGVLHHGLDLTQESDGLSSINETMIVRQSDIHHGTDLHLCKRKHTFWSLLFSSVNKEIRNFSFKWVPLELDANKDWLLIFLKNLTKDRFLKSVWF